MSTKEEESRFGEWAKLVVPVLLPMLIMGCIYLGQVVLSQSTKISQLHSSNISQDEIIKKYDLIFTQIDDDVQRINLDISKLESRISVTEHSQDKIISILADLNSTLERINVTVGKLETRLDYSEKTRVFAEQHRS